MPFASSETEDSIRVKYRTTYNSQNSELPSIHRWYQYFDKINNRPVVNKGGVDGIQSNAPFYDFVEKPDVFRINMLEAHTPGQTWGKYHLKNYLRNSKDSKGTI